MMNRVMRVGLKKMKAQLLVKMLKTPALPRAMKMTTHREKHHLGNVGLKAALHLWLLCCVAVSYTLPALVILDVLCVVMERLWP